MMASSSSTASRRHPGDVSGTTDKGKFFLIIKDLGVFCKP
jgi:hypothetical protein